MYELLRYISQSANIQIKTRYMYNYITLGYTILNVQNITKNEKKPIIESINHFNNNNVDNVE